MPGEGAVHRARGRDVGVAVFRREGVDEYIGAQGQFPGGRAPVRTGNRRENRFVGLDERAHPFR